MSKMWQDPYNLVDELGHITRVRRDHRDLVSGIFKAYYNNKGKVIHVLRNWHMILYLGNDLIYVEGMLMMMRGGVVKRMPTVPF